MQRRNVHFGRLPTGRKRQSTETTFGCQLPYPAIFAMRETPIVWEKSPNMATLSKHHCYSTRQVLRSFLQCCRSLCCFIDSCYLSSSFTTTFQKKFSFCLQSDAIPC
ncbi:unnamed protein product [Acanthoscelides obtectus]|uniref:Uncharacterized protein n=1 Tax=Acanthoscelides obtectus TaxID=200917 RepID=A0A9P0LQI9_ACAOB|nr:unnamed protein product [Acanthoscelides obtectus]CAK1664894.1 hypothetical protein AOBTE_LOCUS24531 [Acanthoscelides obtectus]